MDPASVVGLTASIIQLIETTAKVIGYVNNVKDAPAERAQFARHASSLLALLTDLRYRVEEAGPASDSWFVALRGLGVEGGPLDQLHDQMELLATKLEPSTGRFKKMGKALIWALDKKDIDETLAKLALAIRQDLVDVKEDLRGAINEATAERQDGQFQDIVAWLSSLDFATKQVDFLNRRQPGTGDWLLSDPRFQRWQDGGERTLWCPGLPGAGKTTLASMVIEWLRSQHQGTRAAVIYLYCSYKEEGVQTPREMIGSLLKQVVQHKAALPDGLRHLYDKHAQGKTPPKLEELARLLVQEVASLPFVFVVIDALDECPERDNTRDTLLTEIQKLPQNARILITSRYSPQIDERFDSVPHIDIRATDDDVKRYIEVRIEKESSLAKHVRSDPTLMEEIIKTVAKCSQGMFLLAQLHMDSLAKKLNRRQVRTALGSLPKELDGIYDQAMQRIQDQDEHQVVLAHRVLYWISYTLRPLTIAELRHALAVEPGDDDLDEDGLYETRDIVSVCAGLVTIDEESDQIRLVHYTTQSYFKRIGSARFPEAPSTIAKTCLTYLAFRPFAERYCSSDQEFTNRLDKYPFLRYAASYWGDHVRDEADLDVRELALDYLGNNISILSAKQAIDWTMSSFGWYYGSGGSVGNFTRLHAVASFGLVGLALDLLADDINVNARADWSTTPLHLAAEAGHTEMVRFLLQAKANVAPEGIGRTTPLHLAAAWGHESVVKVLIDAGADPNDRRVTGGKSPLHLAAENGHIDVTRVLLAEGADFNQKDAVSYRLKKHTEREPSPRSSGIDTADDEGIEEVGGTPLNRAAKEGHEAIVLLLLNNGADISATEEDGKTALHQAAEAGHVKLVKLLIERGIDVLAKDEDGQTALHHAAGRGQAEIVQILLESNADVLAEDQRGKTAIDEVAGREHESVLKMLLEHIGRGDETERWLATARLSRAVDQAEEEEVGFLLTKGADPNAMANVKVSLLHAAVARENENVLRLLLDNGASVNVKDSFGRTPLHWAACRGYDAGVRLLLDHHANIQGADRLGATPLYMAAGYGSASVVKQLFENGAQLDTGGWDKKATLSWALNPPVFGSHGLMKGADDLSWAERGSEDEGRQKKRRENEERKAKERLAVLDLLIGEGVDLNAPLAYGRTSLLEAILSNQGMAGAAMVQRLLEKGADVAAQSSDGWAALYLAVYYKQPEVVRLLLEHGADVNQKNKDLGWIGLGDGVTALHVAARIGSEAIARLLIKAGADVRAADEDGMTVLYKAVSNGCASLAIVDLLLAHGVDINAHHDDNEITVLHEAVLKGNIEMVRCLLQRGARIDATDVFGRTALDLAKDEGHEAMVFFLGHYNQCVS
ncbi:hypothetical protein CDV31_012921 [Fusarium ambrosium]|uniref:NACHT domain-containing protein n=1 Tax=Fusarium ambrosium TaxID=131363 RepID=A0A428T6H1_9HYPO|nr:hypothetical protein CDV31_012921 [Fusarium ambrosium]